MAMFSKTRSYLKKFAASRDGNMAVATGVMIVPMLAAAIGLSVDYSMGSNTKGQMQGALDAAVWEASNLDPEMSLANRDQVLKRFYTANGGQGTAKIDSMVANSTHVVLRASATYNMPTSVMKAVGLPAVQITAVSGAQLPFRLTSASFTVTKQGGWWGKSIFVYGRKDGQTSYQKLARLKYGGLAAVGSSSYNPNRKYLYSDSGQETEVSSTDMVVPLQDVNSVYVSMEIEASDGLIKSALGLNQSAYISIPRVFDSDDPNYVKRMFITKADGTVEQNTRTDIYERLRCGETEKHHWEDGGSLKQGTVQTRITQVIWGFVQNILVNATTLLEGQYDPRNPELPSNPKVADYAAITDFDYTITGRCAFTTGGAALTN